VTMKICFFNVTTAGRLGGLETYCFKVGAELARLGCKVELLAGEPGGRPVPKREGVEVYTFPYRSREAFRRALPFFGTRLGKLLERLSFALSVEGFFLTRGYDGVVIVKPFDFPAMWWYKRKRDFPVLFRSGGCEFFPTDRFFSRAVSFFASSSRFNAREIERRYGGTVEVIPNGVDVERFRPSPRDEALAGTLGLSVEDQIVVMVGRLVGWKGVQDLLRALPEVKKRVGRVKGLVIGDGEHRGELERLSRSLGLEETVIFVGAVPHEELPRYLSLAHVLVQPSLGEEVFGIAMLEAMACGLPVVGTRIGGIPEVVAEGETGFLVQPRNPRGLAEAVSRLLSDKSSRMAMGMKGRERAVRQFTWRRNAERHYEIFQALILQRKKTSKVFGESRIREGG